MDNWPNPATAALAIADAIVARANRGQFLGVKTTKARGHYWFFN
jgi:hypothetical protein